MLGSKLDWMIARCFIFIKRYRYQQSRQASSGFLSYKGQFVPDNRRNHILGVRPSLGTPPRQEIRQQVFVYIQLRKFDNSLSSTLHRLQYRSLCFNHVLG